MKHNTDNVSAYGAVAANGFTMQWAVDDSAHVLSVDLGLKYVNLSRSEAIALLEVLNAALPHMAVKID